MIVFREFYQDSTLIATDDAISILTSTRRVELGEGRGIDRSKYRWKGGSLSVNFGERGDVIRILVSVENFLRGYIVTVILYRLKILKFKLLDYVVVV